MLVYKDMAAAVNWAGTTKLPAGVGMAEAEANPDWFLTDTTGKRIEWCDYAGDWQMDVGKASYQDRWAANVGADMRANGWDGVFVDDTNASQSWHLCGRTIAKYPTDAAYASATRSFLANVGPALTSRGFLVIPNIYLPYSANALATWTDWISFTSGGMQEFWSKWGTGDTGHFTGNDWTYRQQFLASTQRAGKIFLGLTYAPTGDVRSMRYARSTFLLDWDGGRSALLLESGERGRPDRNRLDDGHRSAARRPLPGRRRLAARLQRRNGRRQSVQLDRLGRARLPAREPGRRGRQLAGARRRRPVRCFAASARPPPAPPAPAPVVMADFRLKLVKQGGTGADLYWSGLRAGTAVDVFRNGVKIAPVAGERSFTFSSYPDRFGQAGSGKVTWQVCVADTLRCSNTASLRVLAPREPSVELDQRLRRRHGRVALEEGRPRRRAAFAPLQSGPA